MFFRILNRSYDIFYLFEKNRRSLIFISCAFLRQAQSTLLQISSNKMPSKKTPEAAEPAADLQKQPDVAAPPAENTENKRWRILKEEQISETSVFR